MESYTNLNLNSMQEADPEPQRRPMAQSLVVLMVVFLAIQGIHQLLERLDWGGIPQILLIIGGNLLLAAAALPVLLFAIARPLQREIVSAEERGCELRANEAALTQLIDSVKAGIVVQDATGTIVEANPTACELLGTSHDYLIGHQMVEAWQAVHDDGTPYTSEHHPASITLQTGEPQADIVMGIPHPAGADYRWVLVSTVPVWQPETDDIALVVTTFMDITDRKQAEDEIKFQAFHDALTRLPNRSLLEDRLQQALAHARRYEGQLALLYLDLDHFKDVNDEYGHMIGDRLLQQVAQRLTESLRAEDTVARMGGDEFVILMPRITGQTDACRLAAKILTLFAEPFEIDDYRLIIPPSIGISMFPEHGEDPLTLLRHADIALYCAKQGGRRRYMVYARPDAGVPTV